MDATAAGGGAVCTIPDGPFCEHSQPCSSSIPMQKRICYNDYVQGEFPLSANPDLVLHVLSACNLDPKDLAHLEATCSFFKNAANLHPDMSLSLAELAALDMCRMRVVFERMNMEEREMLKRRCGGSWKLVLKFLKAGEFSFRREKCQAIAGPGHSVVVTKSGRVYTFGSNNEGQLGHGTLEQERRPRLLRSLDGIRVIQATTGVCRTMLVTDMGQVYAFGKDAFNEPEYRNSSAEYISTPRLVESLSGIFVVQAAIGNYFTAVLSREGQIFTICWGSNAILGHGTDDQDLQPHQMAGPLENIPVVQIAAGFCYLLALAYQPCGMSVYSVGCGLGGKLGHGSRTDERYPRMIEKLQEINLNPISIAAGAWHAAVVGQDGRVCTWGWGRYGCLGHGNQECEGTPKEVAALRGVKAVHVATGDYTTFVVADNGDVYSFGCGEASLGHGKVQGHEHLLIPKLVEPLKERQEHIVQISLTNTDNCNAHTLALTESGRLYAFGAGDKGQLGVELLDNENEKTTPELVDLDIS